METANIQVIRSRRRTISLEINGKGEVIVRAPYRASDRMIRAFVLSKTDWIDKHLSKINTQIEKRRDLPTFSDDEIKRLKEAAKSIIPKRAEFFADEMKLSYGRITIKVQKTLWGSCSAKGNLNFNCLLMLAPMEVLDYVVVHELCHLRHMNHSKKFWEMVEKYCPDYKQRRAWLKAQGSEIMSRLAD